MATTRALEWESTLTPKRVEYAYGLAQKMLDARQENWANIGFKAAQARDPMLMRALEKMAEFTDAAQERQIGQLMRSSSATYGETRGTTEHQLCREAYRLADAGTPSPNLLWIYGSAAWLCGYNA